MPTPSAAFVPTAGYSRAIHSRSVGAKGARSGMNNSPSGRLCNHTYRQRRVALFRAEAEAASRSRSGQQNPKRQAASRTQHRVNPSIPRPRRMRARTGSWRGWGIGSCGWRRERCSEICGVSHSPFGSLFSANAWVLQHLMRLHFRQLPFE